MFGRVHTKVYRGDLFGKYPTEPYRSVRCGRNTLPNTPLRFGTKSIPVPETPASSVRPLECTPGAGIPPTVIPGVPEFARFGLGTGT